MRSGTCDLFFRDYIFQGERIVSFSDQIDTALKKIMYCNSGDLSGLLLQADKLWPSEYENENAVDETLERLGVDYVDLLYIHQPAGNWLAGYRQLEKAYKEGKAKAIGISNFEGKYIEKLQTEWEIAPQFIQVEAHPYFTQDEEMAEIAKLDKGERYYHRTDEQLEQFAGWKPAFEQA